MRYSNKIFRLNILISLLFILLLQNSMGYQNKSNVKGITIEQGNIKQDKIIAIQDTPQIENFDFERFKKNVQDVSKVWEYKIKDTIRVTEGYMSKIEGISPYSPSYFFSETYSRTIYYPNNYFETYYYYNDGKPKGYVKFFSSDLETGI